ncbi:hypothetical protein [Jeongeupia sp. USM3]|uniref:COG4648 family protein n=1 Tax=Jeongeupia sp. USM3 TaxID=1906741 RepID=UPI00089DF491|nr:hypothetical protein [Jeongeupia sp. USM3]AOY01461.1 hypothetical protein BJP62_13965 [Jeongeupia sp. USM3]
MNRVFGLAAGVALPLLFWLCQWQGWPFWLAGLVLLPLAVVGLGRLGPAGGARRSGLIGPATGRWLGLAAALLGVAALVSRSALPLTFYPVLVNAVLFAVFAASLVRPPPVIERLARLTTPDLPPEGVAYTRRVTRVWAGFFVLNGGIALWTTTQPHATWALYNGLIAYVLIGTLGAGEYLVRRVVMHRHGIRNA